MENMTIKILLLIVALLPLLIVLAMCLWNIGKAVVEDYGWWYLISSIGAALLVCAWIGFFGYLSKSL